MTTRWQLVLSAAAEESIKGIKDRREQEGVINRIGALATEPDKQGKALVGRLAGFRSVRAMGQCYRIVYQLRAVTVTVHVIEVGRHREGDRRDIYERAERWVQEHGTE